MKYKKKKMKMDEGGTIVPKKGMTLIKKNSGKMTVLEETPDSILNPVPTPTGKGFKGITTDMQMPAMPVQRGISYETLQTTDGRAMYAPKFNGEWSDREIANAWASIPTKLHDKEVLRGDAWRDVQNVNMGTSPVRPTNSGNAMFKPVYHPPGYFGTYAKMAWGGMVNNINGAVDSIPEEDPRLAQTQSQQVGGPGFSLSTLPLLQGANALVTEGIYNPQIRRSEARMLRDQLNPVTSPSNFRGLDTDIVSMGVGGLVSYPNALVEGGEVMQTPDGVTKNITGEKHSDDPNNMGGTLMNLPDQTRIFSKKVKLNKDIVSNILDKEVKKKMSPADLAKKFDTKKFEKVLLDPSTDSLAKRTASIMKETNETKLSQIFDAQESTKGSNKGISYAQGGMVGVTKMKLGGGTTRSRYNTDMTGLDPNGLDFDIVKNIFDPLVFPRENYPMAPLSPVDHELNASLSSLPRPQAVPVTNTTPTYTERVYDDQGPSTTPNRGFKRKGANLGEYAPEIFATLNAITDTPVNTARFQPKYLGEVPGLDISAQLDRNYSIAKGAMGSSGNASIDAARAAQLVSNLQDGNNQVYSQKYQVDSQQRYQRDSYNTQIENQANMTNLQRADMFWDKITQRTANKNEAMQNAVSSAYAKTKAMQNEQESLRVAQEMYPMYRYNQGQGSPFEYMQAPDGKIVYIPIGMRSRFAEGDGLVDSESYDSTGKRTYKRREASKRA